MTNTQKIPFFVVSALLAWALVPSNPYGYYQILRVVVCTFAGYLAFAHFKGEKMDKQRWVAVGIALLYNPLWKLHLGRSLWSVANLITIALFLWLATSQSTKKQNNC